MHGSLDRPQRNPRGIRDPNITNQRHGQRAEERRMNTLLERQAHSAIPTVLLLYIMLQGGLFYLRTTSSSTSFCREEKVMPVWVQQQANLFLIDFKEDRSTSSRMEKTNA
eukprot:scaffold8469_cov179-Ochromonas_danica.AAC.2